MKFLFSFCIALSLVVASLSAAVPEINSDEDNASATLKPYSALSGYDYSDEERESRNELANPVLDQVFKFFLQTLEKTFGQLPQILNSELIKQMTQMVPGVLDEPKDEDTSETPETGDLDAFKEGESEVEEKVEVPLPYRKRGKPTAAHDVYEQHHRVQLQKVPAPQKLRSYAPGIYVRACRHYARNFKNDKNPLKKGLLKNFCKKVLKGKKH
ncbi:hypothetical protein QAD02_022357 [Eretmocerus hayati]|uniref:Uncharacterized protein n=2 Tax=Eretmocerus hayati TaxID=131215 RepID=A0ACC2PUC6_9HYME|nr:hypothetical protein QAD02_022355 [Eretmocerus hayati]KAJ8686563.1 hypothetical protein QAD02_022357 [Eretmocerus hayati]